MANLSPPFLAPPPPASALDHQGGLSLWLRAGIFALALLAAARPDRWAWSLPSLHDVFLVMFAYSILGEIVVGVLAVLASIMIFVIVIALLCFDRMVYVPAYGVVRRRFHWNALASFSLAVAIEGAVACSLILTIGHCTHSPETPAAGVVRHPRTRAYAGVLYPKHDFRRGH